MVSISLDGNPCSTSRYCRLKSEPSAKAGFNAFRGGLFRQATFLNSKAMVIFGLPALMRPIKKINIRNSVRVIFWWLKGEDRKVYTNMKLSLSNQDLLHSSKCEVIRSTVNESVFT